jgi:hypothetical protein
MPRTRIALTVAEWQRLTQSVTPEIMAQEAGLEYLHTRLQGLLEQNRQLITERNFHAAQKQEATRKLNENLEEGRRIASALQVQLRVRYLDRPEHLATFGVKPAQGRPRGSKSASRSPKKPE